MHGCLARALIAATEARRAAIVPAILQEATSAAGLGQALASAHILPVSADLAGTGWEFRAVVGAYVAARRAAVEASKGS